MKILVSDNLGEIGIKMFQEEPGIEVDVYDPSADLVWTEPWPESNHSTFAWRGVPSIAFTSTNRVALAHHPYDDLSWSNPKRVARLVPVIKDILSLLAEKPSGWARNK